MADPEPIKVTVPDGKTLTYNGKARTGVAEGTGYNLSGTVKATALQKKNQVVARAKALSVSKAKGKVSYTKKSGDKRILVNKKTGKITLKKGLAKKTYSVKVKVTAAGNKNYKKLTKVATIKIKVK